MQYSHRGAGALSCFLLLACLGCEGPPVPTVVSSGEKPHANVTLRIACADEKLAASLAPLAKVWAGRTGATVEVVPGPMTPNDACDLGILSPFDLGAWAERGDLAAVPLTVLDGKNYQWNEVLAPYRHRLTRWGNRVFALPIAGDGHVVVYRSDRLADPQFIAKFRERFGKEPAPPATWEDFADIANTFRELDGKPSLPALPANEHELADLFFRIAACHERVVQTEGLASARTTADDSRKALSFQHDLETGKPRLTTPAFVTAATWLVNVQPYRAADGSDAIEALAEGRAALAIVNLRELARLPRENGAIAPRFALAKLPGSTITPPPDPATGVLPSPRFNYVPYHTGGACGVVRKRCPHADAAFDLLAELSNTEKSLEVVGNTSSGAGPFRSTQFNRSLWLGYGFDLKRTGSLVDDLRSGIAADVSNPVYVLRGPDEAALTNTLAAELKEAIAGKQTAGDALQRANDAWLKLDAAHPAEAIAWRRRAAGLEN